MAQGNGWAVSEDRDPLEEKAVDCSPYSVASSTGTMRNSR